MIKVIMSSTTPVMRDGITNVMLNLYKNIDKTTYHIDFITINEPEEAIKNQIIFNGSKCNVVPRSIKHPLRYVIEYAKVCRGYDIVHVHGNSATMCLEMLAAKIAGVKVRIAHSHNTYCTAQTIDRIFRIPFRILCNCRMACGVEAGQWLFGKAPFLIINNGIDSENYQFSSANRERMRALMGIENEIVIGNVANFLPAKNHEFIIKVFSELLKINNDCRLLLVGSGNDEQIAKLDDAADRYNVKDKILFTGRVSNVKDYLDVIDVVFMPSINEGYPLTLIEEQANGLSCVVSNNITKNVNLTGNVSFISLSENPSIWVNNIMECVCKHRDNRSHIAIKKIKEANYDIKNSVKLLEQEYFMQVNSHDK